MKYCELCKGLARTYCESDDASLCWNCDVKVHGANFLVARHSRTVLCHACQSPTPWKASGAQLGVTVSVCETCIVAGRNSSDPDGGGREDSQASDDLDGEIGSDEDDEDGYDLDEDDDEEDGDNQVVPWSETSAAAGAATTPPPPASSSSSEEAERWSGSGGGEVSLRKRSGEVSSDRTDQDLIDCSSSKRRCFSESATRASCSTDSMPSRDLRTTGTVWPVQGGPGPAGSGSESVAESPLGKIRRQGLRNLSGGGSGAVDLVSAVNPDRSI